MRFPKEFKRDGNGYFLTGKGVVIRQWNTGKNKNFLVEDVKANAHSKCCFSIPGCGDEAMIKAIETAYKIASGR